MTKEKILIVEDNKALSKLIVKKMQVSLDFEVVAAYSYEEAKAIVEEDNDFFVALLDLNLPDAPDGEVVDMIRDYKIPSIVLTGSMDKTIRESILKKEVIDYVVKGGIDDVHYIFTLIERLHKNREIKVLVVDDSMTQRAYLKSILKQQMFTVLVAAHGEEALVFLEDHPDVKLVVTDFTMPVIDGLALTKLIRKEKSKNALPVIAMTASNQELISAQFLKIGANDFITKPFSKEELLCRIHNALDTHEYIQQIEFMARYDFLTKVYNRHYFLETMNQYRMQNEDAYALAMIDIDDFKKIKNSLGHDAADQVIVSLSRILKEHVKDENSIARFGEQEFCIVLKKSTQKSALEFCIKLCGKIAKTPLLIASKSEVTVTVSIGVSFSDSVPVEEIVALAQKALHKAKEHGKNRVEVA